MANEEERGKVKKVYDDVAATRRQADRRRKIGEGVKKNAAARKKEEEGK